MCATPHLSCPMLPCEQRGCAQVCALHMDEETCQHQGERLTVVNIRVSG